jgi:Txe/YoeB family toxin of Txe-Axe toxin-antitoxin module
VPRVLHLTERYRWTFARRGPQGGSEAAKRLNATLRALANNPLPGPPDFEVLFPPVARYWCRRVPGANLWVAFAFTDTVVSIVSLHNTPPVPVDPN